MGLEELHEIDDKLMYPQRITVWCCLRFGEIMGLLFFETMASNADRVDCDSYHEMLRELLPNQLEGIDVDEL